MGKRKEFIFVGRTSDEIATGIVDAFGDAGRTDTGKPMISKPGRVVQFEVSSFEDGEVNAVLFANGDAPYHPIHQRLDETAKQKITGDLKGANVTMVHSMSGQNTSIRAQGLSFLVRSLYKDYGVHKVGVISPALPYMRSDRHFRKEVEGTLTQEYNAVACREFAQQLRDAGVRDVVGFEPHSRDGVQHYRDVFGKKHVSFINMGAFFAESIRHEYPNLVDDQSPRIIVGSPDGMNKRQDYGIARARSFGEALYAGSSLDGFAGERDFRKSPYMFGIHKERISSKETKIVDFHGDVQDKICIIIDDIISSGSTTLHGARALKERGATKVIALATHGVLVNGAVRRLLQSPHIDQVKLTDTIPGVMDKLVDLNPFEQAKLQVKTVAPLVNQAIRAELRI